MGRMERVNQLMKREISAVIQREMEDSRMPFVTITRVHVSPDLEHAKVLYSYLGGAQQIEDVGESLIRAAGFIRRLIAKRISLRHMPELEFCYDKSIEYSARIDQTIHDIHQEGTSEPRENDQEKEPLS